MITTEEGLRLSLEQLSRVYKTLAALRNEHQHASKSWLAIMAEGWVDQAKQLRREIEEYTGVAVLEESEADLWLSVAGRGIGAGTGPTSILTAILDALRKGVQSVAEFFHAGQLSRRPTATLKEACDWGVVALKAGSFMIGVRLPDASPTLAMWEDVAPDVRRATEAFLFVAAWAASEELPEALTGQFPDPEERRLLLNAVKPFVPRPRGAVENITVFGRMAPSAAPVILTRAASHRIDRAIDQTTTEQVEEYEGDLREIDLDNLSMVIRNAPDVKEVRCIFDESLLETAREGLDRRVTVSGIRQVTAGRRVSPVLRVFRIEVLDERTPADDAEAESDPALKG
jgi:hypothetical protein